MTGNVQVWVGKVAWSMVAGSVVFAVGFGGWITLSIIERPTMAQVDSLIRDRSLDQAEVRNLIDTTAPYMKDRAKILSSINNIEGKFVDAVDANTRAIIKLEATINHLLEVPPREVLQAVQELEGRLKRDARAIPKQ